jgi:hypothetical protein
VLGADPASVSEWEAGRPTGPAFPARRHVAPALRRSSRIAAGFALVGSIVGMLTGIALGADGAAISAPSPQFFGPWGLPALTLPFCFGTLAFVLLKDVSRNFTWVVPSEVVTPEELHAPGAQAPREHCRGRGRRG